MQAEPTGEDHGLPKQQEYVDTGGVYRLPGILLMILPQVHLRTQKPRRSLFGPDYILDRVLLPTTT
jgi:hypothetical protein